MRLKFEHKKVINKMDLLTFLFKLQKSLKILDKDFENKNETKWSKKKSNNLWSKIPILINF